MTAPHVSDETLDALMEIPTQTAIDAMYKMGWPMGFVAGRAAAGPGPADGWQGRDAEVRARAS